MDISNSISDSRNKHDNSQSEGLLSASCPAREGGGYVHTQTVDSSLEQSAQ